MFKPTYYDEIYATIVDWALDKDPNLVSTSSIEDIADLYWSENLGDPLPDAFVSDGSSNPLMDLETTYGEQPYV